MKEMNLDVLIADDIRSAIENNEYPENSRLPSESVLCTTYNVQKMTIRSSLKILKDEGRIYVKNKSGYYVRKRRIVKDIRDFKSTTDVVSNMGFKNEIKVMRFELTQASKTIAKMLKVDVGSEVYFLNRLRIVDERPTAIERSYLLAAYFSGLDSYDFTKDSLYQKLLDDYGTGIDRAQMQLSVVYATKEEAELLNVNENAPLIKEAGITYDDQNRIIEYMDDILLMNRYVFVR